MFSKYVWHNIAHQNYLCKCWPKVHRHVFAGKPLVVSNMSGSLFLNGVQYPRTILTVFVQCWLRSSSKACGTTMSRSLPWLEQNVLSNYILHETVVLMTKILLGLTTKSKNLYTRKMNFITSLNQISKKKLFWKSCNACKIISIMQRTLTKNNVTNEYQKS